MTSWGVTINVGSGPGNTAARTQGMAEWAEQVRDDRKPLLVFAQETSPAWLAIWQANGYDVFLGEPKKWRIQSAMICREDLGCQLVDQTRFESLAYHADYVAAASWPRAPGREVLCVSVHASPNEADPEKYGWPWADHGLVPRDRGNDRRHAEGLWDSDFVLKTLELMAGDERAVLAAGDLNESRLYDTDDNGADLGTWGASYFRRIAEAGYSEPLMRAWGEERATHGRLQLDHVFTSTAAANVVPGTPAPELDSSWSPSSAAERSDHTAVWFPLAT